jgi:hypothetical protein
LQKVGDSWRLRKLLSNRLNTSSPPIKPFNFHAFQTSLGPLTTC